MHRLTADVRRQYLEQNNGFTTHTNYEAKNFQEYRTYTIQDNLLQIRAHGNTSWADSRYDKTWVANPEETHRFLYNNQGLLDGSGIVATKPPRLTPTPTATAPVAAELSAVHVDGSVHASEANRNFLNNLTPKQQILLAVGVALAAVGVWAGFRWGPRLWRTRVEPAARRLGDKTHRTGKRDSQDS